MSSTPTDAATAEPSVPKLELMASRQFTAWLAEHRLSLAFTTYQAGKVFFIGLQPGGRMSVFERTFSRCMGLWTDGQTMWMSSLDQLWRFENALQPGQSSEGYDRYFVPQMSFVTGDLDVHDVAVDRDGRVVFVNTLFGCLASPSERHSFVPLWQPKFLTKLAAEDRCHLNGLAMEGGRPKYVTAVSQTDIVDGWREHRGDGGTVIDVPSDEVVVTGLSMPHSPRVHRDELWVLNSGEGFIGRVDRAKGAFEPLAFCPGYLRGLAFAGDFAVVGMSKPRENKTFSGLALDGNLASRGAEARCGLGVIDLRSGDMVHWLHIEGIVSELYDVVVLPGAMRPKALGFKTDEIRRTISVGDPTPLAS